jgi:hypothetical protein
MTDLKRAMLRHLLATIAFRAKLAVADVGDDFANFRVGKTVRTPGEILAHIGDLIYGSLFLMKGEMIVLNSTPMSWSNETDRFFNGIRELDEFLAGDAELTFPVEKFIQGPVGDALTHVGQIVILRRMFGSSISEQPYFEAEIIPGIFE